MWMWTNTDSLTKWAQILALIVAGYWAYTRYVRVDKPSLEPTGSVELNVEQYGEDACRVRIEITIKNIGHTSFDIDTLHIDGWRSETGHPTDEKPFYFSLNNMKEGQQVLNETPNDLILNQHFPAGSSANQDFTFEFKQLKGLYMIEADAYDKHDDLHFGGTKWAEWSCPAQPSTKTVETTTKSK